MKRFLALLATGAFVGLGLSTSAFAQTRAFGAGSIVLDDGAGHKITIQTPHSTDPDPTAYNAWIAGGGVLSWDLPVPPVPGATSGFIYPGPITNLNPGPYPTKLPYWVYPGETSNLNGSSSVSGGSVGAWDYASPTALGLQVNSLTNTHIWVGNALNVATDVAMGGDASLANDGTLTLANTTVTAGAYGDATHYPTFTVDTKGRLTLASVQPTSGALTLSHIFVGDAGNVAHDVTMAGDATIAYNGVGFTGDVTLANTPTARTDIGLGLLDSPQFTGLTLSGLTANRPIRTNGSSALTSALINVSDNTNTVTGVMNTVNGGTGVASPTAHGVMIAEGASPMVATTLTSGQLLIGSTGADPVAATLTGTLNRLAVSNGAGSVTLNIDPNYVGQNTITTLGTITTGTWNGTTISPTYGGTGLSNPTAHGILVGEGASNVNPMTLTNGQILIGNAGNDPTAATLTGTLNRLAVSNGAGSVTLNIDPNYVGQNTITTLGTITTGTWNGTTVGATWGGTGVSNPTAHALYVGNGASAMNAVAVGATNTVLHGNTGADPTFGAVTTADMAPGAINTFLTTNGAGVVGWNNLNVGTSLQGTGTGGGGTSLNINVAHSNAWTAQQTFTNSASNTAATVTTNSFANAVGGNAIGASIVSNGGGAGTNTALLLTANNSSGSNVALDVFKGSVVIEPMPAGNGGNAGIVHSSAAGLLTQSSVNLAGGANEVTGILPSANGGTGVASPTAHGVVIAEGASPMVTKTLTNGQLLIGSTGADPVAASITATANQTTVTNGAGTIQIGTVQDINTTSSPTFAGISVTGNSTLGTSGAGASTTTINVGTTSGNLNITGLTADASATQMLTLDASNHTHTTTLTGTALEGVVYSAGAYRLGGTTNSASPFLGSRFVNLDASNLTFTSNGGAINAVQIAGGASPLVTSLAPINLGNNTTQGVLRLNDGGGTFYTVAPSLGALEVNNNFRALGYVNAQSGYRVNGSATSGTVLRGNATNYVASTVTFTDAATTGDLMVATGSNAWGNLAVGGAHTVIHGGATPTYGAVSLNAATSDVTGTLPIANGGTNSSTALGGSKVMVSNVGATAIVEAANITSNGTNLSTTGSITAVGTPTNNIGTTAPAFVAGDATHQGQVALRDGQGGTNNLVLRVGTLAASQFVTFPDPGTTSKVPLFLSGGGGSGSANMFFNGLPTAGNHNYDMPDAASAKIPSIAAGATTNGIPYVTGATGNSFALGTSGNFTWNNGTSTLTETGNAVLGTAGAGTSTTTINVGTTSGNLNITGLTNDAAPTQMLTLDGSNHTHTTTLSNTALEGIVYSSGAFRLGGTTNTDNPLLASRYVNVGGNNLNFTGNGGGALVTFDGTNTRVGIGTAAPAAVLDVQGDITATSDITSTTGNVTAAGSVTSEGGTLASGVANATAGIVQIFNNTTANYAAINAAAQNSGNNLYTIPDAGTNADFVMTEGAQTINGNKTISGTTNLSSLTTNRPLRLDGSNNITATLIDLSDNTNTVTGTLPEADGGTGTTTFTQGSVVFAGAGALTEDNANFFWDATNARLGIGTAAPAQSLEVSSSNVGGMGAEMRLTNPGGGAGSKVAIEAKTYAVSSIPNAEIEFADDGNYGATISLQTKNDGASGNPLATRLSVTSNGNVNIPSLTASRPVKTDGSSNLTASQINLASSNDVTGVLPIANGGTNSSAALSGSTIMISNGTSIVQGAAGSTTTVLHGNGAGAPFYDQVVNADIANNTIDLTAKVTNTLPVANGGTNSSTALGNGKVMVSSGGAIIEAVNVTSNGTTLSTSGDITTTGVGNIQATGTGQVTSIGNPTGVIGTTTPAIAVGSATKQGQIQFMDGAGKYTVIRQAAMAANEFVTIPDVGNNSNFVLTEGAQTINGNKTLSGTTNLSALTASRPLSLDASKNITAGLLNLSDNTNTVTGVTKIANGGTNSDGTGYNTNGALYYDGTRDVTTATPGSNTVLLSTAGGAPVFQTLATNATLSGDGIGTSFRINLGNNNTWTGTQLLPANSNQGDNLVAAINAGTTAVGATHGGTGTTTAPASGQIPVGNAGGTAYAPQSVSGDATLSNAGALTLATVNANVGSFGNATNVSTFTVNGKGLITAAGQTAITGLAAGTSNLTQNHIFVGTAGGVTGDVAMSGDATIVASGALTIANDAITSAKILDGEIVNGDINASAAIAFSKLASLATGHILAGNGGTVTDVTMGQDATIDGSGNVTVSSYNGGTAFGDMASQSSNNVSISGGTIAGTTIDNTNAIDGGALNAGSVANGALANSSISYSSTDGSINVPASTSLGGTTDLTVNTANITLAGDVTGPANNTVASKFNGGTSFGDMAGQTSSSVSITGGSIDGTTIGGTTRANGAFTQVGIGQAVGADALDVTGDISNTGVITSNGAGASAISAPNGGLSTGTDNATAGSLTISDDAAAFHATLDVLSGSLTGNRTLHLPNSSGTLALVPTATDFVQLQPVTQQNLSGNNAAINFDAGSTTANIFNITKSAGATPLFTMDNAGSATFYGPAVFNYASAGTGPMSVSFDGTTASGPYQGISIQDNAGGGSTLGDASIGIQSIADQGGVFLGSTVGIAGVLTSEGVADEDYGVQGSAAGNGAGANIIGVWGVAGNTNAANTGAIGVLAQGNENTTNGQTNIAFQAVDGELTVGRTTEAPGTGADVEAATAGTNYTAEGPSGVIEIGTGADVAVANGAIGNIVNRITINNRYVNSSSIILLTVLNADDGTTNQDASNINNQNVTFSTSVDARAAGSFKLSVNLVNASGGGVVFDGGAGTDSDLLRIGYLVINPSR